MDRSHLFMIKETMRTVICLSMLWVCAQAADTGLTPRRSPGDYPVHQDAVHASIAATRLNSDRAAKIFTPEIARNYVIVEVAVYPKDGATVDVQWFDFALRFGGQQETRPDTPQETAVPWREKTGIKDKVQVTTETGVVISSQKDPVTGRRTTGVGTYEGVGVGVGQPPPDPPAPGPDPRLIEDRLRARALPEGKTSQAVAGYLYFARPTKKPKDASLVLIYSSDGTTVVLPLPVK
jgi:hypothetical protein